MTQRLALSFRNSYLFHSNVTKTQANFWSEVHFKLMTNLELSNALAHDAKLVPSFITQRKYRDPRDPLRSLITVFVPPPCHLQKDDQVTDSENTFTKWKEMTRTHPNQLPDTLISLIIQNSIWQFAASPNIQAVREAAKHQNKNLCCKLAPLISTESTSVFYSTNLFLFSRRHISSNSIAPPSAYKPTHKPQFLQSL